MRLFHVPSSDLENSKRKLLFKCPLELTMPLLSSVACQNKEKHVIREGKSKSCKNNEKVSTPIPLSSCLYTLVKCKAHTKVLVTDSPNNLVLNT